MRRASRIAAIGALLVGAGVSQAATIVYSTRTPGTGTPNTTIPTTAGNNVGGTLWTGNAGFDIVRFYAKFTPGGIEDTTSNGLGSVAGTMTASAPFKMGFTQITNPSIDSTRPYAVLDLVGNQVIDQVNLGPDFPDVYTDTSVVNTMINIQDWDYAGGGPSKTNMNIAATNVNPTKDAVLAPLNGGGATGTSLSRINDSTNDRDPRYLYQNPSLYTWNANGQPAIGITEFRVEGAVLAGVGTADASAKSNNANYARGALVAIAVVPTGASVRFRGLTGEIQGIGDDKNHLSSFDVIDGVIPEPGSISLLTLGAIGLLARRSRKQA